MKEQKKTSVIVSEVPVLPSEYVVDCIVGHKLYDQKGGYVVVWYGYGREVDTMEPTENIPKHLITRYHIRVSRRQANARTNILQQSTASPIICKSQSANCTNPTTDA